MRAKKGISDPHFVYYLATSPAFRQVAIKSMVGSSGRQRVQQSVLDNYSLDVPDLPTQRRIASILSALDEKIAVNERINQNLEEQARAVYNKFFVEGAFSVEAESCTLKDLTCLISRGITPKYVEESDQIVLNQKCIRNHLIDCSLGRKHVPKAITEKWIKRGDLLVNSTGEGTLGRAAQVWF